VGSTSKLPKADLILCRDLFGHFSYDDINKALKNIAESGSKYFLTTSFPGITNSNLGTGNWRAIALDMPPFNLEPLEKFNEIYTEYGWANKKYLFLYEIDRLTL